ncbi:MAG TPA: class I SAM-dependent methyltransferase [Mycobacteriales bacterium]|nr:class I SAM-dependent methyltransferase [Mycobacteriales bacterium]
MTLPTCNACGAAVRTALPTVRDPRSGERFSILRCTSCGLGHTWPQPEDLAPYYGESYHGGRHGASADFCTRRRLRFLRQAAGAGPGRLVDVGCGDGTFLASARTAGWNVAGTELNPALPRSLGLRIERDLAELADLAPFDVATMWHSLEHLTDPRASLAQLRGMLRPGGTLLVAVPDAGGWQARAFGGAWLHLDVPRHLFHFDRRSLTGLLTSLGFQVEREWHAELEYDVLGWSQSALNSVSHTPNVFFDTVTRRPRTTTVPRAAAAAVGGLVLSAASAPAVAASVLARRGGTLVVAARAAGG